MKAAHLCYKGASVLVNKSLNREHQEMCSCLWTFYGWTKTYISTSTGTLKDTAIVSRCCCPAAATEARRRKSATDRVTRWPKFCRCLMHRVTGGGSNSMWKDWKCDNWPQKFIHTSLFFFSFSTFWHFSTKELKWINDDPAGWVETGILITSF